MKIYKLNESSKPVSLEKGEIAIGQSGRGRTEARIAVLGDGAEFRAKKTGSGIVLAPVECDDDDRCIIVVSTAGGYSKGRRYDWLDPQGLTVIAQGNGAEGIAGRAGGWQEYMAIAEPGAQFHLRSKYGKVTWFSYDGESWLKESQAERDVRLAIAEVAAGGGEWL